MKRLILALMTAGTVVTSANAQEPKSILLYGDINLTTTRDPGQNKFTNWNAMPGVGYQFNRNWTVGLQLSWGQDAKKNKDGIDSTNNMYNVGPFVRYSHYIGRSETFFWFSQLNVGYQGIYSTTEGNPAFNKGTGVHIGAFPALGINVGRSVCLNFSIGGISYTTLKMENAEYSNNVFNLNFGQQMNFGVSKNFNTGHKMHTHHEPGDEVHHRKAEKDDDDDAAPKPKKRERNRDEDE
jgi:hypothetical protein